MSSKVRIEAHHIDEEFYFYLIDSDSKVLIHPRVVRLLERYKSYFDNLEKYQLKASLNYVSLLEFTERLNSTLIRLDEEELELGAEVKQFIEINRYAIQEHQLAGRTIKSFDSRWEKELTSFKHILDREISRPLLDKQIQASFYLAMMKRSANFSVPGAGKTAMMYGAYAYLSSHEIGEVNKVLVVCPINAFEAWRTEFIEVFGNKRKLKFMNLRDKRYQQSSNIRLDWGSSNIIVINYESLGNKVKILNELIDEMTMLVFDEVHRVKGINGTRAKAALKLGRNARYHYVLTGTPIPNSYKDIYNFLHLLYDNEYDNYFGWEVNDLDNPNPEKINERVQPFFWRTNKADLNVPEADTDNLIIVEPNDAHQQLALAIHENELSILARYIRLLQASTNPSLLLDKIDYQDLGFLDDEVDLTLLNALNDEERETARVQAYQKAGVLDLESEKFKKGIELIIGLVKEGKKVIVWGMFVNTMHKITNELRKYGLNVNLIYGQTPKDDRVELINQFRDGDVDVLVSNPNTLGESISLHQTVHDAVYFEYNFNLTFMLQSRDRIHRLGLKQNQYTRYYYLMSNGDRAHGGFIDILVYERLKQKEEVMLKAIDGEMLLPEVTDDYLEDVKRIILGP